MKFPTFRRRVVISDVPMDLTTIKPSPVEESRIKALARDRFARADRMIDTLAANDDPVRLGADAAKAAQA
ncbi:MAG: hypothetical protein AAF253_14910 [Pseudomonadota bacterium]